MSWMKAHFPTVVSIFVMILSAVVFSLTTFAIKSEEDKREARLIHYVDIKDKAGNARLDRIETKVDGNRGLLIRILQKQ